MCGIAGIWDPTAGGEALARRTLAATTTIAHRGPDGDGVWTDPQAGIGLGHRRLAIIDLSPGGRQPMASADGRLVVTFNGEIYNFHDLRAELEAAGSRFASRSDTEVLVEACARWGIPEAARRMNGIFAFAAWDRTARRLWLVRDHMGVKPLYRSTQGGVVRFASELRAIVGDPGFRAEPDPAAAAGLLRLGYVPAPLAIWRDVETVVPGTAVEIAPDGTTRIHRFWDMAAVAAAGLADPLDLDDVGAVDALEAVLMRAVGRQMLSDVPLGAFLSGGIDSSTVVALMQGASARPVRTFTIGFRSPDYDEAPAAAAVARHLGTDHTELYLDEADALALVPRLADIWDEPFADSSQIPTHLVSAMARRHVTVALSGDGGDELFAGYNRYLWADRVQALGRRVPLGLGRLAAGAVHAIPPGAWDRLAALAPGRLRVARAGDKLHKAAGVLAAADGAAAYRRLVSQWDGPLPMPGVVEPPSRIDDPAVGVVPAGVARMQLCDALTYLPDDILAKVDRASMAVALEARVPLLDPEVVAFAWRLPLHQKIRDGRGKWILRRVLARHVPSALFDRPKTGFGVPLDAWLRGPLRDWAADLLDPRAPAVVPLADGAIQAAWAEHLSGRRNRAYALWPVLMLRAWERRWCRSLDSAARPSP
jgi:asparagine synthase (glutamine-hydrolysing)